MTHHSVTQPHDKFVRETFEDRRNALSFIETYLPSEVVEQFDLDTLEISKDSFIDADLSEHYSDVLYKVGLQDRTPAYIYLLLDHKSYVDPFVPFQLLVYTVRIWEMSLKQQRAARRKQPKGKKEPLRLPPVMPLVLYHGEDRWTVSPQFIDLFDVPEVLRPYLPDYRYWLCDLSEYSQTEIKGYVTLQVRLLLLKYIYHQELDHRLPEILGLLQQLESKKTALEQLEVMIRYLLSGAKHLTRPALHQAVEAVFAEGVETMPTIAEELREEGRQEGRQESEGRMRRLLLKTIQQTLTIRFEVELRQFHNRLDRLDLTCLETLNDNAFTVTTLAEFERQLTQLETDRGE